MSPRISSPVLATLNLAMPPEEAVMRSPEPVLLRLKVATEELPEKEATERVESKPRTSRAASGVVVPIPIALDEAMVIITPEAYRSLILPLPIVPVPVNLAERFGVPKPTIPPPAPAQLPVLRQTSPVKSGKV